VSELPNNAKTAENNESEISMQTFLQDVPPNEERQVSGMGLNTMQGYVFVTPDITLFCSDDICGHPQTFRCTDEKQFPTDEDVFMHYECRNCERTYKTFAIRAVEFRGQDGRLLKFGEQPAFGPPLPARLQRLLQSDRDLLIKGYQAEIHGQGIGAFAYYRRVVEDGKGRLIDEIIKVCKKTPRAEKLVPTLEEAKKQTQFTKAVEQIADAIPDSLRMDNHNPLTLLHNALSRSLHKDSDEQCLEAAQAIRVVLTEFTDSLAQLLKEKAELTEAIKKLSAGKKPTEHK
jgi:hypothetical protein